MNLDFSRAIEDLGPDAGFRIANEMRPSSEYVFESLLPETTMPGYDVKAAHMRVRSTMAGLVGMDSAYPPGGVVEASKFMEQSAKIANEVMLPEETLRQLQAVFMQLQINGGATNDFVQREALNFLAKAIVQPHYDTMEWLRGQALAYGEIDWTFNQKNLVVDYGIPSANILTTRTTSSTNAYGAASSLFWSDVFEARRILRYNVRGFYLNSATLDEIIGNDNNSLELVGQIGENTFQVRRLVSRQGNTQQDPDVRGSLTFNVYDGEADILDPGDTSTPQTVKFLPDGKIIAVGNNNRSGYRVGEGSTPDPKYDRALGYTHISPTVESGGQPGRWSELYTPQDKPYQLNGRGVTNGLPVIEAPEKIVILTTELA